MNLTVVISTFKYRFESLKYLVGKVRQYHSTVPIIICVNGELNQPFDESYRMNMMHFLADVPFAYPIFQTEFRSLSKLWNEGIVHSATEYVYILNDDVAFENSRVFNIIEEEINKGTDMFLAPKNSWSHFVVSKKLIDKIGYFDERLLGVGEEDGYFHWRYEKEFGCRPPELTFNGVYNKGEYSEFNKEMKVHSTNKSTFNREFIYGKKYHASDDGLQGFFDYKVVDFYGTPDYYPAEKFYRQNKKML